MNHNCKNKYCLKGKYYSSLEIIDNKLKFLVPNYFRKGVYSDLIELFYRNQCLGNSVDSVIGSNLDQFISEISESFYLTLSKRSRLNYIFQNALLNSSTCILYFMFLSSKGSPLTFSSLTIAFGILGFLLGVFTSLIQLKKLYKFKHSVFTSLKILINIGPILLVAITKDFLKNFIVVFNLNPLIIYSILLVEVILYIVLFLGIKRMNK